MTEDFHEKIVFRLELKYQIFIFVSSSLYKLHRWVGFPGEFIGDREFGLFPTFQGKKEQNKKLKEGEYGNIFNKKERGSIENV